MSSLLKIDKKHFWSLVKQDFNSSYTGTVFGKYWLLIDPLIYVTLTVFFFAQTMKGTESLGVPYIAWVLPGILMWMFISSVINGSFNAFKEYSYLIRHEEFRLELIIIIKIINALKIHIFAMCGMLLILLSLGYYDLTYRIVLMPIYLFLASLMVYPLGLLVASITPFWPEFKNLFGIFMQIEFWISPIFWDAKKFPGIIGDLMTYNIFYFPIQGYRGALLTEGFSNSDFMICFVNVINILLLMFVCRSIHKKLRPGLGDII
jgi:ABC-type polysaccharide/polyol phosphate export permease